MGWETEKDLLRRWQRDRDMAAAAELWEKKCGKARDAITKLSYRFGFRPEDVLQDVFTAVKVKIESGQYDIDGPAQFSTYCVRVATNILIDKSRKRENSPTPMDPSSLDTHTDKRGKHPDDRLLSQENRQVLARAVMCLPEDSDNRLRTIFCLQHGIFVAGSRLAACEKVTEATIGAQLSRSQAWVSAKCTQAKEMLAKQLGPYLDMA
jgi:RNA polymerase sigma factor (sigma-70 family)